MNLQIKWMKRLSWASYSSAGWPQLTIWIILIMAISTIENRAACRLIPQPPAFGVEVCYWEVVSPGASKLLRGNITKTNLDFFSVRAPLSHGRATRYQQVFAASDFAEVRQDGVFITSIQFRENCESRNPRARGVLIPNAEFRLSTTLKTVDQLSSVFAENRGNDDTVVYTPKAYDNYVVTGGCQCSDCPARFAGVGGEVFFDVPFLYRPSQGNLLLEFSGDASEDQPSNSPFDPFVVHDAVLSDSDTVSRVWAFGTNSTVAERVESAGIIANFQVYGVPKIAVEKNEDHLLLVWPTFPEQFVLQLAESLEPGRWSKYDGPIERKFFPANLARIPLQSLGKTRYFRLFWDSPQPGSGQAASPVIELPTANPTSP